MAHSLLPLFRAPGNTWYVEIHKRQHKLGDPPADSPPPKRNRKGLWTPPKPILDEFHRLMAEHYGNLPPTKSALRPGGTLVREVLERFLAWCVEHRKSDTYEWYRWRLQLFSDALADKGLPVEALKHFHLDQLLASHPGWSSGMKHSACRAVMRALRWAQKKGYIDRNPLSDYEKPGPGKRRDPSTITKVYQHVSQSPEYLREAAKKAVG